MGGGKEHARCCKHPMEQARWRQPFCLSLGPYAPARGWTFDIGLSTAITTWAAMLPARMVVHGPTWRHELILEETGGTGWTPMPLPVPPGARRSHTPPACARGCLGIRWLCGSDFRPCLPVCLNSSPAPLDALRSTHYMYLAQLAADTGVSCACFPPPPPPPAKDDTGRHHRWASVPMVTRWANQHLPPHTCHINLLVERVGYI